MDNNNTIIGKIKQIKANSKITNSELSKLSGVPLGTLNKILSGTTKSVKSKVLQSICQALNINASTIIENKIENSNNNNNFGYVKVGASTIDCKVADVDFNVENIIKSIIDADRKGVELLVFPEMCITGYTLQDLFYQETILNSAKNGLDRIVNFTKGINTLIFVGMPLRISGHLYNVAVAIFDGEILGFTPKTYVPNYNEFYEKRQFSKAPTNNIYIDYNNKSYPFGTKIIYNNVLKENFSVSCEICEDVWVTCPPSLNHSLNGSFITVNLSASDEIIGKAEYRKTLLTAHSGAMVSGYVYADCGWGESTTDLIFAGHNLIFENGKLLKESKLFTNGTIISDIDVNLLAQERNKITNYDYELDNSYLKVNFSLSRTDFSLTRTYAKMPFVPSDLNELNGRAELILNMQAYALAKRIKHINAKSLVVGLSGGLDSTLALLVTCRAVDILNLDRKMILAVTMPCFGTTNRTKNNAYILAESTGVILKEVNIKEAVRIHFRDIGQDENTLDVTYENSQARERTQVLMDIANKTGGIVIGTGDLSELALGWATYNGDHMSMYGVNSSVPKTLIRHLVNYEANNSNKTLKNCLKDILDTPVSPELIPPKESGEIAQKTEDIVGPYVLHDFYLYYAIRLCFKPSKIFYIAKITFKDDYTEEVLYKWLVNFYNRFFAQQFKRSCLPDGVKIGSLTLSPRGDFRMPSDAVRREWLKDLETIKP